MREYCIGFFTFQTPNEMNVTKFFYAIYALCAAVSYGDDFGLFDNHYDNGDL